LELCHHVIVTGPLDPVEPLLLSLLLSPPVPQAARTATTAPSATARATGEVLICVRSSPLREFGTAKMAASPTHVNRFR
jgi:hypothetical protein